MPREIDPAKPLFNIGAVAEILGIKPRMLRLYEERGLIKPSRTDGNRRLYSLNDIDVLAYIQYLTCVKKVNLAGVLEIQEILKKLDSKTRGLFMQEIQDQIERLPVEQRQAFTGDTVEVADDIFKDAEKYEIIKNAPRRRNSSDK